MKWRAVLIGATTGLLVMAVISFLGALVVNLAGGSDLLLLTIIALAAFLAEFVAGYVAGRFAGISTAFHGSFAGLGFYGVSAALLILDGSTAGAFTLVFFGLVSAVIGGAGGMLAGRPRST